MNIRETALSAVMATLLSLVVCQLLVQASTHSVHSSGTHVVSGLAICLAGVALGLLLVLCASAFYEAGDGVERSLGAFGLAVGCALLFALLLSHRPVRAFGAQVTSQISNRGTSHSALLTAAGLR